MTRLRKVYDNVEFKALPDEDGKAGRFEAIVSVFGNVDYQGDRVVKGAFKKSLQRWKASGDPIPALWSHDWADPFAHIGYASPTDVEETERGLKVIGQLDVEKPFAAQVYDLLKTRRVKEWSFSYDVPQGGERRAEDRANELVELDLIEFGPTLKGANSETETIGVKAALEKAAKAGRTISAKNEAKLRQARDLLDSILAGLEKEEAEEEKSEPQEGEKSETPDEGAERREALVRRIRLLTMDSDVA